MKKVIILILGPPCAVKNGRAAHINLEDSTQDSEHEMVTLSGSAPMLRPHNAYGLDP